MNKKFEEFIDETKQRLLAYEMDESCSNDYDDNDRQMIKIYYDILGGKRIVFTFMKDENYMKVFRDYMAFLYDNELFGALMDTNDKLIGEKNVNYTFNNYPFLYDFDYGGICFKRPHPLAHPTSAEEFVEKYIKLDERWWLDEEDKKDVRDTYGHQELYEKAKKLYEEASGGNK